MRAFDTRWLVVEPMAIALLRATTVRLRILGNEMIKNVGKYESRTVSKLPLVFKRTRTTTTIVTHHACDDCTLTTTLTRGLALARLCIGTTSMHLY